MAKQAYGIHARDNKYWHKKTKPVIAQADAILSHYASQGYVLTVRQTYYQFVARGFIPNNMKSYKRIVSILNHARLAGLIDWDHLEDRTRNLRGLPHFGSPADALRAAVHRYYRDRWEDQENALEVWVEKDALVDVVGRAAGKLDVNYFSCRGYTSQSELRGAAERHLRLESKGKQVIVLHFGDHDPSGMDMTRDIEERLHMFEASTVVERVALQPAQIKQYNPPPNPAKSTDSRYKKYRKTHGGQSWELDALDPTIIAGLIDKAVRRYMNEDKYKAAVEREEEDRDFMRRVADSEELVGRLLRESPDSMARLDEIITNYRERYQDLRATAAAHAATLGRIETASPLARRRQRKERLEAWLSLGAAAEAAQATEDVLDAFESLIKAPGSFFAAIGGMVHNGGEGTEDAYYDAENDPPE